MFRKILILSSAFALFGAVLWQVTFRDLVHTTLGIGREIQKIDDFPYRCRKITDNRLTACEDLWLDDQERILYAACATTEGRLAWNEAVGRLNISARREGGTEFLALSIDNKLPDGSFPIRAIELKDYISPTGDSSADLLGFDAEIVDQHTVRFYVVNQRPPVDAQRRHIDASKIGANSTIDVFEHRRGSSSMRLLRSVWNPSTVYTPNNVAAIGAGAFVVTNDHSKTVGLRKRLDHYIGGGGVTYCSASSACFPVTPPRTFRMPNGLARGADGLIYVPATISGTISVYELTPSVDPVSIAPSFTLIDTLHVGMPLDNLALDASGDLWIPGFPNGVELIKWIKDPQSVKTPATVWRIRRVDESYRVEKVLEDSEAKVLNGITTVRHDVRTGRLFMGGAFNEFVVCDPIT